MIKKYGSFPQKEFEGAWCKDFIYLADVRETKQKVRVHIHYNKMIYAPIDTYVKKMEIDIL